jgi:hypothetical protein
MTLLLPSDFYEIENHIPINIRSNTTIYYRFRSKFNSCVGVWRKNEDEAEKDGLIHARIIAQAYNIEDAEEWKL